MIEPCVAVFYHTGTLGDTVYFERGSKLPAFRVNRITRASRARLKCLLATLESVTPPSSPVRIFLTGK